MLKCPIIALDKSQIAELKEAFKDKSRLNTADLKWFFRSYDADLKDTTINWRIYELVQRGVLSRIGKGVFILGSISGREYSPKTTRKLKSIYNKLSRSYPFLDVCVWTTAYINEFMTHQPGKFFLLVEVEKGAVESVFRFMRDNGYRAYLEPTRELIDRYISEENENWIVRSLVTEAPTQTLDDVTTVTLEKMLVDIFSDRVTFAAQQGSEMRNIFINAYEKYSLSETKMLRYADRRRRKPELETYLNEVSIYRQQKPNSADL